MKKNRFKNKKRVVVKIGSSSLTHPKTGNLDFIKLERLVRELCDLRNQDIDVCLVSSGAISVGRKMMGIKKRPKRIAVKQACAAVGQASLMMTYQKLFSEYHQTCGQVLMTKKTMIDNVSRKNAENTFEELFACLSTEALSRSSMKMIPSAPMRSNSVTMTPYLPLLHP